MPLVQCAAVTTHSASMSEAPHKYPPPRHCRIQLCSNGVTGSPAEQRAGAGGRERVLRPVCFDIMRTAHDVRVNPADRLVDGRRARADAGGVGRPSADARDHEREEHQETNLHDARWFGGRRVVRDGPNAAGRLLKERGVLSKSNWCYRMQRWDRVCRRYVAAPPCFCSLPSAAARVWCGSL